MPKLRNAGTDVSKFTQWLGRKCRNHNPLSELGLAPAEQAKLPRMYKAKGYADVKIASGGDRDTLLYAAGNRVFAITVREVRGPRRVRRCRAGRSRHLTSWLDDGLRRGFPRRPLKMSSAKPGTEIRRGCGENLGAGVGSLGRPDHRPVCSTVCAWTQDRRLE